MPIKKAPAAEVIEILINIRSGKNTPAQTLTEIFQGTKNYNKTFQSAFLEFFSEVPPGIMKRYMSEEKLTREQIIDIFNQIPDLGPKLKFKEALDNGEF